MREKNSFYTDGPYLFFYSYFFDGPYLKPIRGNLNVNI